MRKVLDALLYHASDRPDAIAFAEKNVRLTYKMLAHRVSNTAGEFSGLPQTVGILAENSLDWIVADLALAFCGKTTIPFPTFFSTEQLNHIIHDGGVEHILCSEMTEAVAQKLGIAYSRLGALSATPVPWEQCKAESASRIIYTSGTTGAPKGVRLGDKQISASACSLVDAIGARENETYLSVLPFSLLLEQITAIAAPLLVGAKVGLAPEVTPALAKGDPSPLVSAFELVRPNVSVLVPSMLAAWTAALTATKKLAPDSLRYVAVGGAAVPEKLVEGAWHLGIPAYVGYGLSECCSVVSVTREGNRVPNSVGTPLADISVEIVDGEIVVHGDTVMNGYLGGKNPNGTWYTGDLGELDHDGTLRVLGRKDSVLVTANGRNVSPEWIEAAIESHPAISRAITLLDSNGVLSVLIAPIPEAEEHINSLGEKSRADLICELLSGMPDYAIPARHALTNMAELFSGAMLNAAGEPRRKIIANNLEKWFSPSKAEK